MWRHTGVSAGHEEHGDVAAANGERADTDDVSYDDTPSRHADVEETLSATI